MIYGKVLREGNNTIINTIDDSISFLIESSIEIDNMFSLHEAEEGNGIIRKLLEGFKSLIKKVKDIIKNLWSRFLTMFKKKIKESDDIIKEKKKLDDVNKNDGEKIKRKTYEYIEYDKVFESTSVCFTKHIEMPDLEKDLYNYIRLAKVRLNSNFDDLDGESNDSFKNKYVNQDNNFVEKVNNDFDKTLLNKIFLSSYKNHFSQENLSKNIFSIALTEYLKIAPVTTLSEEQARQVKAPNYDQMISTIRSQYNEIEKYCNDFVKQISIFERDFNEFSNDYSKECRDLYNKKMEEAEKISDPEQRKDKKKDIDFSYNEQPWINFVVSDIERSLSNCSSFFKNYSSRCLDVVNMMQRLSALAVSEYIKLQKQLLSSK